MGGPPHVGGIGRAESMHKLLWKRGLVAAASGALLAMASVLPAAAAGGPPPAATALRVLANQHFANLADESINWGGYVVTSPGNTAVSGTWTVPKVVSPPEGGSGGGTAGSAAAIGIGGYNTADLIALGTEQDLGSGGSGPTTAPVYYAWYELAPAAQTKISALTVHAGDVVHGAITMVGADSWHIALKDVTTGAHFATTVTYSSSESSAEWLVADPSPVTAADSGSGGATVSVLTLADFGTLSVSHALVREAGTTTSIGARTHLGVIMVSAGEGGSGGGGVPEVDLGPVTPSGSFTVTYIPPAD